ICVAEVLETRSFASIYEECLLALKQEKEKSDASAPPGAGQRRKPRLPVRIRVISPGMQALSRDFNQNGMQLEVERALEVGTELMLTLELGTKLFPKILVPAKVVWTREGGRRKYFVGVEFGELAPALQYQLAEFERFLQESQSSDIYRRQVTDFDKHLRRLYPSEVSGLPADPLAPAPAAEDG
ncbi:MAG: PilZ domain-containing protein, partial [Candidatus Eremiobacterota bacterium]